MALPDARPGPQRKAAVLARLEGGATDVWVASASAEGEAHLVPLSLAWDGTHAILATEHDALTTRNIRRAGRARLGLGPTRDVIILDTAIDEIVPVDEADRAVGDVFARHCDWDPRGSADMVFILLRPLRIQAWREENELKDRTLMRDGAWLY